MKGNECQRNLNISKKATAKFFKNFEKAHDVAHNDFLGIQTICKNLSDALDGFSSATYGSGQSAEDTECQIAEFLTAFYGMRVEAIQYITHLRYYCDVLLNMADDFRCGRKMVCNADDQTCSGCEADTNKLNCDLAAFYAALAQAGAYVKQQLSDLLDSCDILGEQARTFGCTNNPRCQGSECGCGDGESNGNILSLFSTFISEFTPAHDVAHTQLENIGNICDLLTKTIQEWEARF